MILVPHKTNQEIHSLRALEVYLQDNNLRLARSTEISESQAFLKSTRSNWEVEPQGCILLFEKIIITDTPDETSPVGRKMIPDPKTKPALSKFLDSSCAPLSFESTYLPKDQVIWVWEKELEAA